MVIEVTGLGIVVALDFLLIPRFGVLGGILASWAAWAFVVVAEAIASGAARVIVWREFWGVKQDIRLGRELLTGLLPQ
jgi:hypothetical protein